MLAQEEARGLKHNYIGTEHVLLGIVCEEEGLAAVVLRTTFDITPDRVRSAIVNAVGTGESTHDGQIPFTPRAKKVLELALREALELGHNYIGTEHILLGLLREGKGLGMRILSEMVHDYDAVPDGSRTASPAELVRNEVVRMLSGPTGRKRVRKAEAERKDAYGYSVEFSSQGRGPTARDAEIDLAHKLIAQAGELLKGVTL